MGNIVSPLSPWLAYLNIFAGLKLQTGAVICFSYLCIIIREENILQVFCPLGAFQSLIYAIGPLKIKKEAAIAPIA